MPASVYSLSPSPGPQSLGPASEASADEAMPPSYAHDGTAPVSRASSPEIEYEGAIDPDDIAKCEWENCGKVFDHLPTFIEHLHNGALYSS